MLTTVLPFSLWLLPAAERKPYAAQMAQTALPHLSQWLAQARCVSQHRLPETALTSAHEWALAQAQGASGLQDGLLPSAALAAQTLGLTSAPDEGWAILSLCHWQVSNGQVILGDPQQLLLDEAIDAQLFAAMQPFFAEDGVSLFPWRTGHWLAKSKTFVNLPTASLERVLGRNINAWLIGGEHPNAQAQLVRRLQNEMQMWLYTHQVNAQHAVSINSFWLHGTGSLSTYATPQPVVLQEALRESALQHDFLAWLDAWKQLDGSEFFAALQTPKRLILCGEDAIHVYESFTPSWWHKLRQRWSPNTLDQALFISPQED